MAHHLKEIIVRVPNWHLIISDHDSCEDLRRLLGEDGA